MSEQRSGRFASLTSEDIAKLITEKDSKNTKTVIKMSVKLFRDFLSDKGEDIRFEDFSVEKLDQELSTFWPNARQKDGTMYKKKSLLSIKFGIKKQMMDTKGIDIDSTPDFKNSVEVFRAVASDLKKSGYGSVTHKAVICEEDMAKLHGDNKAFDMATPRGLQMKVWFDVMYYMCRRGRENLREMTKKTFSVKHDAQGNYYVSQDIDELDKNHRADDPDGKAGRMYAIPGKLIVNMY